jgi:hypothetical protein
MYIVDTSCISPQHSFSKSFIGEGEVRHHEGNQYKALEPSYQSIIAPSALRRMAKALRMGVGAGGTLVHRNDKVDGIVIGTAYGGLDHCLMFLNQIVEYKESTLTPTNFVQSTSNNIASQLAVLSSNTGYNSTHVHKGLAFEAALLEAQLLLEDATCTSLLVGATEEISEYNFSIDEQAGLYKPASTTTSTTLLSSNTSGTVCGEGASMFIVQAQRPKHVLAKILEVDMLNEPNEEEIQTAIHSLLARHHLVYTDVKAILIGNNGDARTDHWYTTVVDQLFNHAKVVSFKHWIGEYPTASAFALWLSCEMLKQQDLPLFLPSVSGPILIYNHYNGVQHGLILVNKVE